MKTGPELTPNLVINSVKPILHKMKLNVYDTQTHNSHFYETNNVASIGAKIDSVVVTDENVNSEINSRLDYFEAQFNLGLMHRISGNHEMAISVFRKALALRPTHRETHEQLGMALIYFGNYAEGLRERIKGSGAIEFYNQGNDTFKVLS